MGKIKKILIPCAAIALALISAPVLAEDTDSVLKPADGGKTAFSVREGSTHKSSATSAAADSPLRVAGIWLLVLGVAGGAFVLACKRRNAGTTATASKRMEVVERLAIGTNRELLLVRACDRMLVVAAQSNQMSLLTDLPTDNSPTQPFADLLTEKAGLSEQVRQAIQPEPRKPSLAARSKAPLLYNETASAVTPVAAAESWPELETA